MPDDFETAVAKFQATCPHNVGQVVTEEVCYEPFTDGILTEYRLVMHRCITCGRYMSGSIVEERLVRIGEVLPDMVVSEKIAWEANML